MQNRFVLGLLLATVAALSAGLSFDPVRHEDASTAADPRTSQIIGFGLVVGLDGTGSKSTFTQQVATDMFHRLGVPDVPGSAFQAGNVSAVMVVAEVGSQVRRGRRLDVTVEAMDDASSLAGGTLLATRLKGANGIVYAQALGPVSRDAQTKAWRIRRGAVAEWDGTVLTGRMGPRVIASARAR